MHILRFLCFSGITTSHCGNVVFSSFSCRLRLSLKILQKPINMLQ